VLDPTIPTDQIVHAEWVDEHMSPGPLADAFWMIERWDMEVAVVVGNPDMMERAQRWLFPGEWSPLVWGVPLVAYENEANPTPPDTLVCMASIAAASRLTPEELTRAVSRLVFDL
jgi:hypothetical protein